MPGPATFLHLSDIHFREREAGGDHVLNEDLRDRLENDLADVLEEVEGLQGILVTGDIAFSGSASEFAEATAWLERLGRLTSCSTVLTVPGNHDVDRRAIQGSMALRSMRRGLKSLVRDGKLNGLDDDLHEWLRTCGEVLAELAPYNEFASRFGCNVSKGGRAHWWDRSFELDDGVELIVRGLTSSLVCDGTEYAGAIVMGEKQVQLPAGDDTACLTMCHHPVSWWADGDRVKWYMSSRASVQLYGHKHVQHHDKINNSLVLSAGAVHPDRESDWDPRYNVLRLSVLGEGPDRRLTVDLFPRRWNSQLTRFVPDRDPDNGALKYTFDLPLPARRRHPTAAATATPPTAPVARGWWESSLGRVPVDNLRPRLETFSGRSALLTEMHRRLLAKGLVVLSGESGVGKSALALEYAHTNRGTSQIAWWIDAAQVDTMTRDLRALASAIEVAVALQDQERPEALLKAVMAGLMQERGWLLVFDGLEDVSQARQLAAHDLLGMGVIIVTRREVDDELTESALVVGAFEEAEAVEYVARHLTGIDAATSQRLADFLGRRPMALEQAVAYLQTPGANVATYLDELRQSAASTQAVRRGSPAETEDAAADPDTAAIYVGLSQLGNESPAAAELLEVLAEMGTEECPIEVVDFALGLLAERSAIEPTTTVINVLVRSSLASFDESTRSLSLHAVTRGIAKGRMTPAAAWRAWSIALNAVNLAFPLDVSDENTIDLCARLLPHARAVTAEAHLDRHDGDGSLDLHAGRQDWEAERDRLCGVAVELLLRVNAFLREQTGLGDVSLSRDALALSRRTDSVELIARATQSLSRTLWNQGDLEAAVHFLGKALEMHKLLRQADEASFADEIAADLALMGRILFSKGAIGEARSTLEDALTETVRHLGPTHWRVVYILRDLSMVLKEVPDLPAALARSQEAIDISQEKYADNPMFLAECLRVQETVLQISGDLPGARERGLEALRLAESLPTPDWQLKRCNLSLAETELLLDDLRGAATRAAKVTRSDEAKMGAEHWVVAQSLRVHARALNALGNWAEARELLERAVGIHTATYGRRHWVLGDALRECGAALREEGDLPRAMSRINEALAIFESVSDQRPFSRAASELELGRTHAALGDSPEAAASFERALSLIRATYGEGHWFAAEILVDLAASLHQLGNISRAEATLAEALSIYSKQRGPAHTALAKVRLTRSKLERSKGELGPALEDASVAATIWITVGGVDHPQAVLSLAEAMLVMATLESDLTRRVAHAAKAAAMAEERFGGAHWRTAEIRREAALLEMATTPPAEATPRG
jgi:tetratricopeptide (TPR) repeat protein/predicted phosphodiesterase